MTNYFKHFDIPEAELWPAIGEYVTFIETGETKDTCKCEWLEDHSTGLKLQRVEESLECPVHTKEGFLLGFFQFLFPDSDIQRPADEEPLAVGVGLNGKPDVPIDTQDLSAVLKARIENAGD